jgi:hypothetical protein
MRCSGDLSGLLSLSKMSRRVSVLYRIDVLPLACRPCHVNTNQSAVAAMCSRLPSQRFCLLHERNRSEHAYALKVFRQMLAWTCARKSNARTVAY